MTNHITTPCLPQLKTKATADLSTIGSIQSKPVFRIALGNFCKPCSRPNSTRCSAARAMSRAPITRVAGWKSTRAAKRAPMLVCLIGRKRSGRTYRRDRPDVVLKTGNGRRGPQVIGFGMMPSNGTTTRSRGDQQSADNDLSTSPKIRDARWTSDCGL
jgi:hypothetical protein